MGGFTASSTPNRVVFYAKDGTKHVIAPKRLRMALRWLSPAFWMGRLKTPAKALAIAALAAAAAHAAAPTAFYGPERGVERIDGTKINPATETTLISISTGIVAIANSNVAISSILASISVNISSIAAATQELVEISTSISVVGGSGFTTISSTGTLFQCSIAVPVSTAAYNFEMVTNDVNEFLVYGKDNLVGKVALFGQVPLIGSHKARMFAAQSDGTYNLRCTATR